MARVQLRTDETTPRWARAEEKVLLLVEHGNMHIEVMVDLDQREVSIQPGVHPPLVFTWAQLISASMASGR